MRLSFLFDCAGRKIAAEERDDGLDTAGARDGFDAGAWRCEVAVWMNEMEQWIVEDEGTQVWMARVRWDVEKDVSKEGRPEIAKWEKKQFADASSMVENDDSKLVAAKNEDATWGFDRGRHQVEMANAKEWGRMQQSDIFLFFYF